MIGESAAMTRLIRLALLCTALLSLAQCGGWLPPFETVASPASGDSAATRVAVCYNALTASPEQLLDIATASCGPGEPPQRVGHDLTLSYCPLLTPARATFACAAP
jgi:hypothetical protein